MFVQYLYEIETTITYKNTSYSNIIIYTIPTNNRLQTIRYVSILPNFKTKILQTIYRYTINYITSVAIN